MAAGATSVWSLTLIGTQSRSGSHGNPPKIGVEFTKRIAEAQSFEGLIKVYQWMETDRYSGDDEIE
jgi:hypothetical protein